jgi:rhamnogalacturonyl hydrolase YesR
MTFKMIISSKQKRNYINARNVTDCLSSFGGVLLLLFVCISSAQADPLIKIADDVVSQTAVGVPTAKNKPNPTRYNLWMYQNFMIMEGMDALGEVTGNESYKNYTKRSIDFFAAYQSKFGDSMKAGPAGTGKWYTKPRQLWQTGMVATFAVHHKMRPNPEFVRGMKTVDDLFANAPTFDNGVLVRNKSKGRGLGLQIDDLYMIAPYWCRKAQLLEDSKWLDRAIDESLHYFDYLWDTEDKLMHPLWMQKRKGPYGLYWGRGNGWYIMAITDLLTFIPQDHPKRKEVLNDYRSFINGIIARQGEEGMWYQILDKSDSYQETSCSGMFTYCILKGINEGWLDDSYFPAAKKGWHGLLSVVNENNELTGVCPPSDISEDPNYYLIGRAPRVHDQHGIGPFLLAGTAYLQANKKLKK